MANQNAPNSASGKSKAEGERNASQQSSTRNAERSRPEAGYDESGDAGGGITNRPLDEEVENQEALPQRGNSRKEEDRQSDSDRGSER